MSKLEGLAPAGISSEDMGLFVVIAKCVEEGLVQRFGWFAGPRAHQYGLGAGQFLLAIVHIVQHPFRVEPAKEVV